MLPKICTSCYKAITRPFEGLHPFITSYAVCPVYTNTSWVERRGCAFNATPTVAQNVHKTNPLKASKRKAR